MLGGGKSIFCLWGGAGHWGGCLWGPSLGILRAAGWNRSINIFDGG